MATWQEMKEQAEVLHKSRFFGIQTPEQALAVMMIGQELQIGPAQSLRSIQIIDGKPTIKPELQLGLCLKHIPGFSYEFGHCDHLTATVTVSRPGLAKPFVSPFTIADAQRAGLIKDKSAWVKYPANMLRWRALANALHIVAPDVLVGIYTPEEIGEDVDASGELVNAATAAPQALECANCHSPIVDGLVQGSPMTAQSVADGTLATFGRRLCIGCANAASTATVAAASPDPEPQACQDPNYDPFNGPNDENPNNPKPAATTV